MSSTREETVTMTQPPAEATTTPRDPLRELDDSGDELIRNRRRKLEQWRDEDGLEPYGRRVDGLTALADARDAFDAGA
ncbi:MAG: hypothetical protein KDA25_01345, partial [Phycisphaerales bacterium]|nr:hypothetical protein [Phycisphaerales bacterium]